MTQQIVLTHEGFGKLKAELAHLKSEKRLQVAERIRTAKEHGDLAENAEYHEAKEEQAFLEGRIAEIEHILATARIADKPKANNVGVGSTVVLSSVTQEVLFHIVGTTEADPRVGKISAESPVGKALLGKHIGETVVLHTPTGNMSYTIKEIQ